MNGETDDSRNIYDAANNAAKMSHKLGFRKPLMVLGPLASGPKDACWMEGDFPLLNMMVGALDALYTVSHRHSLPVLLLFCFKQLPDVSLQPIQVIEAFPERHSKFDNIGVFGATEKQCTIAYALEEGRRVARDIAASDPERMAPPKVVEYLRTEFAKCPNINMEVDEVDPKEYPLMDMVNRCASGEGPTLF